MRSEVFDYLFTVIKCILYEIRKFSNNSHSAKDENFIFDDQQLCGQQTKINNHNNKETVKQYTFNRLLYAVAQ